MKMNSTHWKNHPWAGVFPATLCAFHEDESLDEPGLRSYFEELDRKSTRLNSSHT